MGGVGVRSWELACALAKDFPVRLAIPNNTTLQHENVEIVSFDLQHGDLHPCLQDVRVIIIQGFILHFHPYLREVNIPLAIDLYVPFLLESLVWHSQDNFSSFIPAYEEYTRVQLDLIRAGDFFFCASERQRDYWLGWLHAQKRINPHTYAADATLRNLIDIVPFGLPEEKLKAEKPVLKGVHPGIGVTAKVILWSGGLWDWLDPLTLIRAVGILAPYHPELILYFLGTQHPNSEVTGMKMPEKAIQLSKELGLLDRQVFFGDWVPYEDRSSYLAEADLSVITHLEHIETHFSFRTRVLDCFWAGLPMVITEGDSLSQLVADEGVGLVVPPGDVQALATAIDKILKNLGNPSYTPAFERLRERFCWEKTITPLHNFCADPHFAADKGLYLTELERITRDKDAFWRAIVDDRDAVISRYRSSFPFRIYAALKRLIGIHNG